MALCYAYKKSCAFTVKKLYPGFNSFNQFIKMLQPYPNRLKLVKRNTIPIPVAYEHLGRNNQATNALLLIHTPYCISTLIELC